jgi:hypothetical protein
MIHTFMRSSLPIAATPPLRPAASSPLLDRCLTISCLTSSRHIRRRLSNSVRLCSAFKCSLRTSRRFLRSASSSRRSRRTMSLYLQQRGVKSERLSRVECIWKCCWGGHLEMLSPAAAASAAVTDAAGGAGAEAVFNDDLRDESAAFSTSFSRREFSFFSATICRTRNSRSSSWHLPCVLSR